jgi:hypothetical protein
MSGFWGYGSEGHEAFHENAFNELLETVHGDASHIDPLVMPVITHAFAYYGAVSVWSCEGHPERGDNKGYITWIFKDAVKHMAFLAMMNQAQTWMHNIDQKAHLMFELEANPLHHSTTEYDTMAMPSLTLRTMSFRNNRIKARWWDELLECITKITQMTKGL